jgi:hypothetical protein
MNWPFFSATHWRTPGVIKTEKRLAEGHLAMHMVMRREEKKKSCSCSVDQFDQSHRSSHRQTTDETHLESSE